MGAPDKIDRRKIDSELKGKTLDVYLYMLKKNELVGVREIQRVLHFKAPSVAQFHIEKLVDLNIVSQDQYGRYYISQKAEITVLEAFTIFQGRIIPRMLLYATFFSTLLVSFVLVNIQSIANMQSLTVYSIGFATAGAAVFWFETVRAWKRRVF